MDSLTGVITTEAGNGNSAYSGDGGPAIDVGLSVSLVAVDSDGNLLIADSSNDRIRRVDAVTGIITTVAGNGESGFLGDGGPAIDTSLDIPRDVGVDSAGNIFIVSSTRIRRVDGVTGIITTVAGNGELGFSGDGGPATSARLDIAYGVAVDSLGNLFVAELINHRIRRVDGTTGTIVTVAGGSTGDGGPATGASLASPGRPAVDRHGNLYIADRSHHRIRRGRRWDRRDHDGSRKRHPWLLGRRRPGDRCQPQFPEWRCAGRSGQPLHR